MQYLALGFFAGTIMALLGATLIHTLLVASALYAVYVLVVK